MTVRPALRASALVLLLALPAARADDPPTTKRGVPEIVAEHDRALVRDLVAYVKKEPKASDAEQAYLTVFEKAIDHDWFDEVEGVAASYLKDHPEGPVRPMALIVTSMARAAAGKYEEALTTFKELLKGLERDDQTEFAVNFADSLANSAAAAGEIATARKIYEALLVKYGDQKDLRDKVQDDLDRLNMVGKPAPVIVAKDLKGGVFRLSEWKGKYVLIDFWATWCGPCLADLPGLQTAYEKYHAKGFEIVGVSLDETADPVKDFVKERKLPWRQIHNASAGTDLADAFGVNDIPASFLIAPDGRIVRLSLRAPDLDKVLKTMFKD